MRKVALFFMALCAVAVSCVKTTKVPVSYILETDKNTPLKDIYITDSGTYTMPVVVKFLTGYHEDKVTMSIKGLPADIKVAEDTFSEVPTYKANFVLTTKKAAHATYPITVVTSALGTATKYQTFNITVVSADCAAPLAGSYSCNNACIGRTVTYTSTCTTTGNASLDIVNFGGYGSSTLTHVTLDCNHDSLTIPSQNIGNGTILSGKGAFNGNTMTIYYVATMTPLGHGETCSLTMTKQ